MKYLLLIFLNCFLFNIASAQVLKKQIGTSVWKQNDVTISDSSIAYIKEFDKTGRLIKIWQLVKDVYGVAVDSATIIYDTKGQEKKRITGKEKWSYEYDKFGTTISMKSEMAHLTFEYKYIPKYDKNNKLISKTVLINGMKNHVATVTHDKDTMIVKSIGVSVHKEVKDKYNHLIFNQEAMVIDPENPDYRTNVWTRDSLGNELYFIDKHNNEIVREVIHYYVNGIEKYQIEKKYNPDLEIYTVFRNEYW